MDANEDKADLGAAVVVVGENCTTLDCGIVYHVIVHGTGVCVLNLSTV